MNVSIELPRQSAQSDPAVVQVGGRDVATGRAASRGVIIATINREHGETGIHAHTRILHAGLIAAGNDVRLISAFCGSPVWLGMFAVRRALLDRMNLTWGTRWHRHWHRVALEANLLKACRSQQPSVVVAQCPLSAAAALNVRQKLNQDFRIVGVCHFNHSEATEYREKGELTDNTAYDAILTLEADVLRRADAYVYVSDFARQAVEIDRQLKPRKSIVIWNGIDAVSPMIAVDRSPLGLAADDVVICNVGTLERRKNQLGSLDLFAKLVATSPKLKLLLVGDGPDRPLIEQKIATLKLTDHVKLLGFRRDVPAILAASDLYLHYAKLENCPVVLLEAARAGLPIVTTPAGGAAEVLRALGAGMVIDAADSEGSAAKIAVLLQDRSLRKQVGAATAKGFLAHFTREAMIERYLQALHPAAGAR